MPPRHRGSRLFAVSAVATCCALAGAPGVAGCSAPETRASVTSTEVDGFLGALPEIRQARVYRALGARELETAYRTRRVLPRETRFQQAMSWFDRAQASYHDALAASPSRYHEVIDVEIEAVRGYMLQIQREREPRLPHSS